MSGATELQAKVSFNHDIRPLMSDICFQCHGPDANAREADLRLDIRSEAIADRDGSVVIVPEDPEESLLIYMINAEDEEDVMPPVDHPRSLTDQEKQLFHDWIAEGAEYEEHWAYVPPVRKELPQVKTSSWVKNPIDHFILAKLEEEGLQPSSLADKETLLRRVTLDLTGLPPGVEEIDAFLKDTSSNAYEKVVDRLLASPRYGERMVWDWLEAARYSDSNGYQNDPERGMWPWRDWAVKAFNDNMPYNQFSIEQIAGDLLPNATREQKLATAFLRNHMINGEGGRLPEENRIEYLFDQAETVATIWMGVTMTCARCHDHKYDPITQREYYQLIAFFNKTEVTGAGQNPNTPPVLDFRTEAHDLTLEQLQATLGEISRIADEMELEIFPRPAGEPASKSETILGLENGRWASIVEPPAVKRRPKEFRNMLRFFGDAYPEYAKLIDLWWDAYDTKERYTERRPIVMVMEDSVERDTFILNRGIYNDPTDQKVQAGFPAIMNGGVSDAGDYNRLDLATWLFSDDHPLTARVTVNRYWQYIFGQGLLKQVENFGVQSVPPKYEALIDWLAVDFRESGWDLKATLKKIVMSATYQQSSKSSAEANERDPDNSLLARGPRFRLPSWMIRDQALYVSGIMVEKLGGPAVQPYQPDGIWEEASFGTSRYVPDRGEGLYRRSVYTFWKRIVGPTLFFDSAPRQVCEVKVQRTNTPLHALSTLNDVTYAEAARKFAERILGDSETSENKRLKDAFRMVTSRWPKEAEFLSLQRALENYKRHFSQNQDKAIQLVSVGEAPRDKNLDSVEHAAWSTLCLMLLNLDETLTKE
ncbi:MAG: PSD1 and planctomycete cytochrome C domain-containing protein [Verrucomicrobia bacterium]|nr:PSD1 and planctomycete cytochrome C domain-containing protein [Verrucomicrobiota bacterium]